MTLIRAKSIGMYNMIRITRKLHKLLRSCPKKYRCDVLMTITLFMKVMREYIASCRDKLRVSNTMISGGSKCLIKILSSCILDTDIGLFYKTLDIVDYSGKRVV